MADRDPDPLFPSRKDWKDWVIPTVSDYPFHYQIVVLRDDQLERIAEAVAARLAAAVPVEEKQG